MPRTAKLPTVPSSESAVRMVRDKHAVGKFCRFFGLYLCRWPSRLRRAGTPLIAVIK
jgi:hypothetical protein